MHFQIVIVDVGKKNKQHLPAACSNVIGFVNVLLTIINLLFHLFNFLFGVGKGEVV